jgi:hypothetical protein
LEKGRWREQNIQGERNSYAPMPHGILIECQKAVSRQLITTATDRCLLPFTDTLADFYKKMINFCKSK